MIYLDHAATTPVDPEVADAMMPYLREEYGNPSGKYYCQATHAKDAVEQARAHVADLIGAKPEEIIFTAGATESTNFIIKGYLDYQKYYGDGRNQVITSNAEHKATLHVCHFLNGDIYSNSDPSTSLFSGNSKVDRGFSALFLPVDQYAAVSPEQVEHAFTPQTALVSLIYVNNEVGTINNVCAVGRMCREHDVRFHVDATQAVGKIPVSTDDISCDFMSFSAHKLYGPKGIGCAYLRSDGYGIPPITALLHGGEQEYGFRAGTLAVHNIVGFGKAAEIAKRRMTEDQQHAEDMDAYFLQGLSSISDLKLINPTESRMKGIFSILVERENFNNERFIRRISDEAAISTGSACSAGEPSHVIEAIGQREHVHRILRVSLGRSTTRGDIDAFLNLLK
ncbi:MAG TPA: cysteine desulfurase family protein [Ruminococcus sp.]|nr:cysteine desulfurase family protein [Ruminococcus sp.]